MTTPEDNDTVDVDVSPTVELTVEATNHITVNVYGITINIGGETPEPTE